MKTKLFQWFCECSGAYEPTYFKLVVKIVINRHNSLLLLLGSWPLLKVTVSWRSKVSYVGKMTMLNLVSVTNKNHKSIHSFCVCCVSAADWAFMTWCSMLAYDNAKMTALCFLMSFCRLISSDVWDTILGYRNITMLLNCLLSWCLPRKSLLTLILSICKISFLKQFFTILSSHV